MLSYYIQSERNMASNGDKSASGLMRLSLFDVQVVSYVVCLFVLLYSVASGFNP